MRTWLRDRGLLLANLILFVVFIAGMALTGFRVYNSEQAEHGGETVSFLGYLTTGDFVEATFENWESEFLQMGMYVVLTAYLFQRGSSESKPIDEPAPQDEDPREHADDPQAPWPVRHGGWVLKAYENSLAGLFFLFFLGSWLLHAAGGARAYSDEQVAHGGEPVTACPPMVKRKSAISTIDSPFDFSIPPGPPAEFSCTRGANREYDGADNA